MYIYHYHQTHHRVDLGLHEPWTSLAIFSKLLMKSTAHGDLDRRDGEFDGNGKYTCVKDAEGSSVLELQPNRNRHIFNRAAHRRFAGAVRGVERGVGNYFHNWKRCFKPSEQRQSQFHDRRAQSPVPLSPKENLDAAQEALAKIVNGRGAPTEKIDNPHGSNLRPYQVVEFKKNFGSFGLWEKFVIAKVEGGGFKLTLYKIDTDKKKNISTLNMKSQRSFNKPDKFWRSNPPTRDFIKVLGRLSEKHAKALGKHVIQEKKKKN
jgi:hypothetical protein